MMTSVLALEGISKSYQDGEGKRLILDHVDLEVKEGEFVAILGPSGSGKSTLLTISGALLSADTGSYRLDGQVVNDKKQWTQVRRDKMGFIFQNHHLLPFLTVKDQLIQVAAFKETSKEEISQSIDRLVTELGIEDCLDKFPKQLSGGQKQRVAIARAFINKPRLILADEPTASLDESRGRQVAKLIRKEVKEKNAAAIMVTHDERLMDLVDKIYRLEEGRLIEVFY